MAYFTKKMNWFQFTIHLKEWVNSQLIFQLNFFHLKYILRKILNQIHPNGFSLCNWAKSIFQELWKGNISIIAIRYVFWRTKTDIHSSVDFRLRCNFLALGIQEPRKSRRNTGTWLVPFCWQVHPKSDTYATSNRLSSNHTWGYNNASMILWVSERSPRQKNSTLSTYYLCTSLASNISEQFQDWWEW